MESGLNCPLEVWPTSSVGCSMSVCVRVCVCGVSMRVCVLSSWHSSTNLSSIQIFHSDGKRPDSNSIVPWKVHFHCSTSNKICHVLKGQMPGLGQMWDPVMIFTCQIVSNPRLHPRGGGSLGALASIEQPAMRCSRTAR